MKGYQRSGLGAGSYPQPLSALLYKGYGEIAMDNSLGF